MDKTPRIFPIWFLPLLVLVIFWIVTCQGCRGGRALGNGSAGTVIIPQTPQEINERNYLNRGTPFDLRKTDRTQPPVYPLPPLPITPDPQPLPLTSSVPIAPQTPVTPPKAVKSAPALPESKSAEANPVKINPKPAGNPTPFSPTINKNAPPVIITSPVKNLQTDSKSTDPQVTDSHETAPAGEKPKNKLNIIELGLWYLFLAMAVLFIYTVYKTIQERKESLKKPVKKAKKKTTPPKNKKSARSKKV